MSYPLPIVRNIEKEPISKVRFRVLMLIPILVGFALRLYGLSDQVILDDEWHGLEFVTGRSFGFLLTHFGIGATCIPLNLYRFALFHSLGWSEVLLKLPAIIPGLFSLLIFPFMVKRIFGSRIALLFTWLLAIAPFLIFYSRVLRPYSMVAFLTFTAIGTAYIWMKNRGEEIPDLLWLSSGPGSLFPSFRCNCGVRSLGLWRAAENLPFIFWTIWRRRTDSTFGVGCLIERRFGRPHSFPAYRARIPQLRTANPSARGPHNGTVVMGVCLYAQWHGEPASCCDFHRVGRARDLWS